MLLATLFLLNGIRQVITVPIPLVATAFAVQFAAATVWMTRNSTRLGTAAVEWAMVAYLLWNLMSMFVPHEYPSGVQLPSLMKHSEEFSVPRLILTGTVIPFTCYAVGRYTVTRVGAVAALYWAILLAAAYSALVSVLQFTGPASWVWPRDIVTDPLWTDGRALGVFHQPVINGMVLVLGFVIGTVLARRPTEPGWRRLSALVIAIACAYGAYLTHTRAVWLSAAVVLLLGAALDKGLRTGYVMSLCLVASVVVVGWGTFTSADRAAGGIASQGEIFARLNINKTALWAAAEKPFTGWGIGRFPSVNTYHHQQWSQDIPWDYGYGYDSHQNELGILAELGLFGLVPWVGVIAALAYGSWKALSKLSDDKKPLAVVAVLALVVLFLTGLTVDLRFFSFPVSVVFLVVGIAIGSSDREQTSPSTPDSATVRGRGA